MGRPKRHDERTRATLVAAAERLLARGGLDALSIRAVAAEAETTTRAVYSVFGDKEGLLEALAEQAFLVLQEGLESLPESDDPVADLVDVGAQMYRGFVNEHPWLFRIAFQRVAKELRFGEGAAAARARCWVVLESKVGRLPLAGRPVLHAAVEFNAVCEGLANAELRGGTLRRGDEQARVWRDAFETIVRGLVAGAERSSERDQMPMQLVREH